MKPISVRSVRCAIYTRVSTDQGLEQEFNSLDAQREASEAYIRSQTHEGWVDEKRSNRMRAYDQSDALLVRLITDDRGNRMTPVYTCKNGVRYRYYQSWVLANGRKTAAGTVCRVPAEDVERAVSDAVCMHLTKYYPAEDRSSPHAIVRAYVERIVVHGDRLEVSLCRQTSMRNDPSPESDFQTSTFLTIPWSKPSASRHREILGGDQASRPIRSEARSRLITGIARGRRWLEQIASGKTDIPSLAQRHDLSEKTVRSTISLAFLAPGIVQAAIEGRLPRGLGISQMTDLPVDWSVQHRQLGLASPTLCKSRKSRDYSPASGEPGFRKRVSGGLIENRTYELVSDENRCDHS